MRGIFLTAAFATALGACAAAGGVREIRTSPSGALVTIERYGECVTPCKVKLDGPRKVRVAKAGYVARDLTISPGAGPVMISLELAAATEDVDTVELPDFE